MTGVTTTVRSPKLGLSLLSYTGEDEEDGSFVTLFDAQDRKAAGLPPEVADYNLAHAASLQSRVAGVFGIDVGGSGRLLCVPPKSIYIATVVDLRNPDGRPHDPDCFGQHEEFNLTGPCSIYVPPWYGVGGQSLTHRSTLLCFSNQASSPAGTYKVALFDERLGIQFPLPVHAYKGREGDGAISLDDYAQRRRADRSQVVGGLSRRTW